MRSLWLLLLLAFVGWGPGASALRCYKCEDCDENTQLSDMDVCEGPLMSGNGPGTPAVSSPSPSPAPSPSPSPSPAESNNTNIAPGNSSGAGEEEEDDESEETATIGIMPAGNNLLIKPGSGIAAGGATGGATGGAAGGATAGGTGAAAGAAAGDVVSEEEEEDEDEEEERRKRRSRARQVDLDVPIAFCYTVRLQRNESTITKRGCTTARMSNQTGGCEGLFENWTVAGCQLCQDDGCNQPIAKGSASGSIGQLWTPLALTLMAFAIRHPI
ncbi:uncharacterized protein Dere_GG10537 [Drosophila erecta]|uniref:Uncharacterized protein n=1 Tax=Drosophila erecta TaxID=7220 RepID=B3N745_DROER|nr:uncharacterized protein Dere_GG10537 [Drosophila erecta]